MTELDRAKFLKGIAAVALGGSALGELLSKLPGEAPPVLPPPVPEAAPMPLPSLSASSWPLGSMQVVSIGYKDATAMFPGKFPTLEKAAQDMHPATSPKIEWLIPEGRKKGRAEHNFTQIFRTSYFISGVQMASRLYGDDLARLRVEALLRHLQDVENTLIWGHRMNEAHGETGHTVPLRAMGGTIEFKGEHLRLRPLRDLVLRRWADNWKDGYSEEYLGEVSLEVF